MDVLIIMGMAAAMLTTGFIAQHIKDRKDNSK